MTYNGWKNYETWCVSLWIDNEEGSYNQSREMARDSESTIELADALKDWIEESAPEMDASVWSDLLNAALSEVDWYEIAENYREEVASDD